jgi:hypothetical protein
MKTHLSQLCLLIFALLFGYSYGYAQNNRITKEKWLTTYDFDVRVFKAPPSEFGPFARWW